MYSNVALVRLLTIMSDVFMLTESPELAMMQPLPLWDIHHSVDLMTILLGE